MPKKSFCRSVQLQVGVFEQFTNWELSNTELLKAVILVLCSELKCCIAVFLEFVVLWIVKKICYHLVDQYCWHLLLR